MEHLHSFTAGSMSHSELEDLAYSLFTTLFPYRELHKIVHVLRVTAAHVLMRFSAAETHVPFASM